MTIANTTPIPEHSEHLTHPKYRADIDGLRAIAILSVVGFHAFPYWFKGGFVGVDVFFVISGFLISTIIIGSLERNSFSIIEFYSRRINRIFPALVLVLVASFAFGWFALFADEYKQLGKHIAGGAGFISNFLLWNENGYFDNLAETKPLLHLWSLGVEEQFYIVWPALLWFAWKRRLNLLTIAIAVGIISFALNIGKVRGDAVAAFYSPQTRFWELMAGSVLSCMAQHKQNFLPHFKHKLDVWLCKIIFAQAPEANGKLLSDVQSLIGGALIFIGVIVISKERHFPGWWAVLPTLGATLIISAGAHAWFNRVVLSNRVLVWFGLISFPLYLWHWPLLSFARIVESEMPSRGIRIVAVLISIVLAWLTYQLVEKPMRFSKAGRYKTSILLVLMVIVGCAGYAVYERDGLVYRANIKNKVKIDAEFVGALWKYTKNDICLNHYPLKGVEKYGWWFCMASKDEKPTLLLLGNSHANELYAGLSQNNSLKHHSILSIGTCDAAWVDESKSIPSLPGFEYSPCVGFRHAQQQQFIDNIIEKSASVKFVIMDGLSKTPDEDYIKRIKKRIDFLEKNHIKVIVFTPHISISHDIKGCFPRPFHEPTMNCDLSREEIDKISEDFKPLVQQISATYPDVVFFNQNQLFCGADKCSLIHNGMPLLRDTYGHIFRIWKYCFV